MELKTWLKDGEKTVFWVQPNLEREATVVRKAAKDFGIAQKHIYDSLETGTLEKLDPATWRRLKHTDSNRVRPGYLSDVKRILEDTSKNWERVAEAFEEGGTLPAPVVLYLSDGTPFLLSGNVRLMVARAMRDTPRVLVGHLPKHLGITFRKLQDLEMD